MAAKYRYSWILIVGLLIQWMNFSQINGQTLSFPNFGPVAFDSFFRTMDNQLDTTYSIKYTPRYTTTTTQFKGQFFTQYFRANLPIKGGHMVSLRFPYHGFNVPQDRASLMGMQENKGYEWGDIDILIHVRFLQFLYAKNWLFYAVGEMHTAPTGRENKQFIDALKLIGSINAVYTHTIKNSRLRYGVVLAGGGWDDTKRPYQKHIAKFGAKIDFYSNKNKGLTAELGGTYLLAEGEGNRGYLWNVNGGFTFKNGLSILAGFRQIKYIPQLNGHVNTTQVILYYPFRFHFKK